MSVKEEKKQKGRKPGKTSSAQEQKEKAARKRENRPLFVGSILFCCLFAGLIFYLCAYVAANTQTLFDNSYNSRQSILATQNKRGTIYSADREVLAMTQTDEQGAASRSYPYDNLFAHIVGYSDKGKTGIENLENYYLINSDIPIADKIKYQEAGDKNPGDNVFTTLRVDLQQAAYDAMGVYRGAVVATEPKTGRILAMVSKPDFNPNEIAAIWDEVSQDQEKSALLNRATQGLYPPGSTFKIVTALEYIRENAGGWPYYSYSCNGSYTHGGNTIRCYHGTNHGRVGFELSFAKSCNASFANIGMSLDRGRFLDTIDSLLFDEALPLDIPYSKSSIQLTEYSSDDDMIQTVIGQGKTQITPIHLNMITAAIANSGMLMKPYVVQRVETAKGELLKQYEPEEVGQLLTAEEAGIMTGLMEAVVEKGTASKLDGLTYSAAGKTGSAEFGTNKEDSHAWFAGFAPADDPQIAVTVIIEGIGSGGDYAVPIAKRVFDAYFHAPY